MDGKGRVEVTIVNKYYPPSTGILAESARDLAKYLQDQGVHVHIVHTKGEYKGAGNATAVVGEIHKVNALYTGKSMALRFVSEIIEAYMLIKRAKKIKSKLTIVMTAPGFLGFWASKLFKRRKHKWIYWTMDLFPEAFVAGNLTSEKNPLYKYFFKTTYSYPPHHLLALGEVQAQYLRDSFKENLPTTLLPCGVTLDAPTVENSTAAPEWKDAPDKIYFGYTGNLGQAHSVDFLKWIMDAVDPDKHRLILVVYGAKAHLIKSYLNEKHTAVRILDFVPRPELPHIDIHLTSLNKEFVNVCVPSKLVSAVYAGCVFLFFGIENCDSWQYLNRAGWIIKDDANAKKEVEKFIGHITKEIIAQKKLDAKDMPDQLKENTVAAYNSILKVIQEQA